MKSSTDHISATRKKGKQNSKGKRLESKKNTSIVRNRCSDGNIDSSGTGTVKNDPRFDAALSRPHFQTTRNDESKNKVVLDERFASVLTDPRFQLQERDRYGRRQRRTTAKETAKDELSAFYTVLEKMENDDDDDDGGGNDANSSDDNGVETNEKTEHPNEQGDDERVNDDPASRIAYLTALSRGELDVSSSSSDDESIEEEVSSSDEEEEVNDKVKESENRHAYAPSTLQPLEEEDDIEMTFEPSPFLAVLNMDWEHTRAADIFSIMASFTPPGAVKRVSVYPSDFGMEQMAKEERYGPMDIWNSTVNNSGQQRQPTNQVMNSDDDDDEDDDDEDDESSSPNYDNKNDTLLESDFDDERLRAYEISKLRYYFAVVEFSSPEHANMAYQELDGQELEHSSAEMDLRAIPPEDLKGVIQNRTVRDETTSLPANYQPPDFFVIQALQQSSVQCTWEEGDADRERTLTKYSTGRVGAWNELTEQQQYEDDLRAYLASDQSSDDDEDEHHIQQKTASKRSLLGLDSDDDHDNAMNDATESWHKASHETSDPSDDEQNGDTVDKVFTYIPGNDPLEEKIKTKLMKSKDKDDELTPWEKYQLKRKQKKKERKQAVRNLRKDKVMATGENAVEEGGAQTDDFFLDEAGNNLNAEGSFQRRNTIRSDQQQIGKATEQSVRKEAEELELLFADEGNDDDIRDFDIRGLQRIEKNKDKKLRGTRKQKELAAAAEVAGKEFQINLKDDRFAAVLGGTDARYGIDRTDPNFKETPAMREILEEQMKRRQSTKKRKREGSVALAIPPNTNADSTDAKRGDKSSGATALTELVKNLKNRVTSVAR